MNTREALDELAKDCTSAEDVMNKLVAADCMDHVQDGRRCTTCPVAMWLQIKTGAQHAVDSKDCVATLPNKGYAATPNVVKQFIYDFDTRQITKIDDQWVHRGH